MLQTIQEETATNIYYPSPLQDLLGPDANAGPSAATRNNHIIWITGEFFGVQRARDMLFQVSLNKVCLKPQRLVPFFFDTDSEQNGHLEGHRNPSTKIRLDGY